MRTHRIIPCALGALLLALSAAAGAQPAGKPTAQQAADMAAVHNFKLTTDFVKKYEGYSEEAAKKPCQLSPLLALAKSGKKSMTLDQTATTFDAQPGVHAALARHDLSARELLLGTITLSSAAMQEMQAKHPELAGDDDSGPKVSAANMAFYHTHGKQILQHQRRIGREQLKHNGGKLPACLSGGKS